MGAHDADEAPATRLSVDIGGLRDFAAAIRGHVDGSLRSEARRAFEVFELGVPFGASLAHCPDIQAARQLYHRCLTSLSADLVSHLATAEAMVAAAEQVAQRYGDADARSAASASDVDTAFAESYQAGRHRQEQERVAELQRDRRIR
jgi:hypothetical protein